MKYYPEPEFILKSVQLSELLVIRHCVFVMGPPGSGKSSTWKVLARAMEKMGNKTDWVDMNPKVVSTKDL
jgi:dynein heavy chain